MGQNFTRSINWLLILSPRYVMVTCLIQMTLEGGEGDGLDTVWRIVEAKRLGEERGGGNFLHSQVLSKEPLT